MAISRFSPQNKLKIVLLIGMDAMYIGRYNIYPKDIDSQVNLQSNRQLWIERCQDSELAT